MQKKQIIRKILILTLKSHLLYLVIIVVEEKIYYLKYSISKTYYTTFSFPPSLPFFLSTAVYDTKGEETRLRNETTGAKSISKNLELQLATLDNEASRCKNVFIL